MNRLLKIGLIVVLAYAFTVLAVRAEPRYPAFSHSVAAPGVAITFAMSFLLRRDFMVGYLDIAFNTLIYSGLIALLLKVCKVLLKLCKPSVDPK